MADHTNYYTVLGISPDADAGEIKAAYRKLARRYHPDVNRDPDAGERFREVNAAHEVLSDTEKRREYDLYISVGGLDSEVAFNDFDPEASLNQSGRGVRRPPSGARGPAGDPFGFGEIFGNIFSDLIRTNPFARYDSDNRGERSKAKTTNSSPKRNIRVDSFKIPHQYLWLLRAIYIMDNEGHTECIVRDQSLFNQELGQGYKIPVWRLVRDEEGHIQIYFSGALWGQTNHELSTEFEWTNVEVAENRNVSEMVNFMRDMVRDFGSVVRDETRLREMMRISRELLSGRHWIGRTMTVEDMRETMLEGSYDHLIQRVEGDRLLIRESDLALLQVLVPIKMGIQVPPNIKRRTTLVIFNGNGRGSVNTEGTPSWVLHFERGQLIGVEPTIRNPAFVEAGDRREGRYIRYINTIANEIVQKGRMPEGTTEGLRRLYAEFPLPSSRPGRGYDEVGGLVEVEFRKGVRLGFLEGYQRMHDLDRGTPQIREAHVARRQIGLIIADEINTLATRIRLGSLFTKVRKIRRKDVEGRWRHYNGPEG